MDKIFTWLRALLACLAATDTVADPLGGMTPCELADLPPHHPRS